MTSVPPDLQAALAGRYQLHRLLGRGGMAVVYLAGDLKHGREVAVKVFRPEVAATVGTDRFLREIAIAARLQHPNVLTLIDSGQSDGFLFYVMPFVAGESLRGRLDRRRTLEVDEALRLTRETADALAYAHLHGVLHRDIKPENILLSADHAMVADFGIARAIGSASDVPLTRTGFPIGTPGYMSPEQAAGLTDLDQRTDVFSLAVVTYEMLVGDLPGRWLSEEALRRRRFLNAPPAHRAMLDRLPAAIEPALAQAMAVDGARRFPGPLEFAAALEGRPLERRQYSDEEARALVNRAAELEARAPTSGAMTLGGVQELAAEAGIEPRHVLAAARELDRPPAQPAAVTQALLGAPYRLLLEQVVPREVAPEDYAMLEEEIALALRNRGLASRLSRGLSWRTQQGLGQTRDVQVHIRPEQGSTRITIEEPNGDIAGGYFGGMGGGGGSVLTIIGAAVGGKLIGPPAAVLGGALGLLLGLNLARLGFRFHAGQRRAELTALLQRLARHIARGDVSAPSDLPREPGRRALSPPEAAQS